MTLANGERRSVGMVVNASFKQPTIELDEQAGALAARRRQTISSSKGSRASWRRPLTRREGISARRPISSPLGNAVGYNAWARSQGYATRPFSPRDRFLKPYNMGRRSLCSLGGVIVSGAPAWMLSRLSNLLQLPGLERNLRILLDWLLDIPFAHDIAVLAPDQTERMQRKHFEAGDTSLSRVSSATPPTLLKQADSKSCAMARGSPQLGRGRLLRRNRPPRRRDREPRRSVV